MEIGTIYLVQQTIHYSMHFLMPGLLAFIFFRKEWKKAWIIMLFTMVIDLDHLFATPIFNPCRCSVGFHYLHTYPMVFLYVMLLFFPKTRIVGVGLVFHILTDIQDCWWIALSCGK